MKKHITQKDLGHVSREIVEGCMNIKKQTAHVVALSGDLGAGKTTLTQHIAHELRIGEKIQSPTFVIMKFYPITRPKSVYKKLIHIDAYRLSKDEELKNLGWDTYLASPENLIIVEWPEHVSGCIPLDAGRIYLSHVDDETRSLEIS